MTKNIKMGEDEKKVVIARLLAIPENALISIGSYGMFSKKQLIEEVEKESDIGNEIVYMQMLYLKSFKNR